MTLNDLRMAQADDGRVGIGSDRPRRRLFVARHKRQIWAEYDAAIEPGAAGRAVTPGG